jgi:hypothetical protein
MSNHIISIVNDPIAQAMANLTDAGLDPTLVAEWWSCDREAA